MVQCFQRLAHHLKAECLRACQSFCHIWGADSPNPLGFSEILNQSLLLAYYKQHLCKVLIKITERCLTNKALEHGRE